MESYRKLENGSDEGGADNMENPSYVRSRSVTEDQLFGDQDARPEGNTAWPGYQNGAGCLDDRGSGRNSSTAEEEEEHEYEVLMRVSVKHKSPEVARPKQDSDYLHPLTVAQPDNWQDPVTSDRARLSDQYEQPVSRPLPRLPSGYGYDQDNDSNLLRERDISRRHQSCNPTNHVSPVGPESDGHHYVKFPKKGQPTTESLRQPMAPASHDVLKLNYNVTVERTEISNKCNLVGKCDLEVTPSYLMLSDVRTHGVRFTWPFSCIRRFSQPHKDRFRFEGGRKSVSGPGEVLVKTKHAKEIFEMVHKYAFAYNS